MTKKKVQLKDTLKKRKARRAAGKTRTRGKPKLDLFLRDFISLNEGGELRRLNESDLSKLLEMELKGKRRRSFVEKIHSALSTKRTRRERRECLDQCEVRV